MLKRACLLTVLWLLGMIVPAQAACLAERSKLEVDCAASEIYVYLSLKSAVAGSGSVLVVAEIMTPSGYSPADGTPAHFVIRRGRNLFSRPAITYSGLAYTHLPIGQVTGPMEIWVVSGLARSETQRLDVVPAEPAEFSIQLGGCDHGVACVITADGLSDIYGNTLADGLSGVLETRVDGALVAQQIVEIVHGTIRAPWSRPEHAAIVSLTLSDRHALLQVKAP